ncbi:MAG: DUF2752 domain-containing protein [Bryobacteraceae bacterium]|jgi:hypothetical protein
MIRLAMAAALFGVLWIFTPAAETRFHLCGFYWLTGHPCALCGMTRAMFAMAKGHFAEAVRFNALAPLGFAMVFALFSNVKIPGKIWMAGIAAFAIYGVCRIFVTQ